MPLVWSAWHSVRFCPGPAIARQRVPADSSASCRAGEITCAEAGTHLADCHSRRFDLTLAVGFLRIGG
jgi:hypothetical protein